ncbi:ABC transporter ATP-binding protein [Salmonella enterica subsp. enterica serovar Panama]|uniref:ABC transporter ATP-binding protein n=1 Tax=Salmonella enterica subsp. enterica serovar Panama TaxID=29472 RepID=A0A5U8JC71_SALET|nr:ABC transporter ATP-binding protein [Salmonella enterica subsp. enterica serovar Panama]EBR8435085.1 ABC transporter ATP-binding protein [Salmonella enterica subsp. enterica serovar Panama]EBW9461618.1 ABC transporter ATP-binding protein [Salmonella enterica subsp. enterica serovar Panama]
MATFKRRSSVLLAIRYVFASCPVRITALIVVVLLQGLIPAVNVFMTGQIITLLHAVQTNDSELMLSVAIWCISLLGLQLMQPLVNLVQGDVTEMSTNHFSANIMRRMNDSFSLSLFDNKARYEQLEYLKKEAAYSPLNFIICMIYAIRATVMATSLLLVLINYSGAGAAICALSAVPMIIINIRIQQRYIRDLFFTSRDAIAMRYVYGISMDKSFLQEIRLYGLGRYLLTKFNVSAGNTYNRMHKQRIRALITPVPAMVLSLVMLFAGVTLFLSNLRTSDIAVGALVMVFQSIVMMKSHLDDIVNYGSNLVSMSSFFTQYHSFMTEKIEPVKNGHLTLSDSAPFSLSIQNLRYQYEGRQHPALNGVNLEIAPGEKVAILGDNGSGKTTLIKIILRMYAFSQGVVLVSGLPLDRLDIENYRNQVATVFQDYGKYEFTVGENIALNNYDAEFSSPAIDELLSQVGFPCDQHTRLGKQFGGDDLSMGQWQRLAIARALYRKANLFIFDEFSSSLDPETEHRLFNDILALNTTVLAVTHRLGNIKEFDRIIVMSSGKVIENGDFDSLMNLRGKFHDMWYAQFKSVMTGAV